MKVNSSFGIYNSQIIALKLVLNFLLHPRKNGGCLLSMDLLWLLIAVSFEYISKKMCLNFPKSLLKVINQKNKLTMSHIIKLLLAQSSYSMNGLSLLCNFPFRYTFNWPSIIWIVKTHPKGLFWSLWLIISLITISFLLWFLFLDMLYTELITI